MNEVKGRQVGGARPVHTEGSDEVAGGFQNTEALPVAPPEGGAGRPPPVEPVSQCALTSANTPCFGWTQPHSTLSWAHIARESAGLGGLPPKVPEVWCFQSGLEPGLGKP